MHLVKHLKSFQTSSKVVSSNDEFLANVACISPIHQLCKVMVVFNHALYILSLTLHKHNNFRDIAS